MIEMDVSEGVQSVTRKSSLDKKVEEEAYGSWMVVDRQWNRGHGFSDGAKGVFSGSLGGSRFFVLNMET